MGKYTSVKSNFIKGKIKKTKWFDRYYIDQLIKIERLALGKRFGSKTEYIRENLEEN
jgi:hypothetical protein